MDSSNLELHTIWSHKTRETLIFLLFFQYFTFEAGVKEKSMISSLLQSINSGTILFETALKSECHCQKFRTGFLEFIKINQPNRFQTLTFGRNLGFQKPGSRLRQPPGGFIFPEMTPNKKNLEMSENIKHRHFLIKWLSLLCESLNTILLNTNSVKYNEKL